MFNDFDDHDDDINDGDGIVDGGDRHAPLWNFHCPKYVSELMEISAKGFIEFEKLPNVKTRYKP